MLKKIGRILLGVLLISLMVATCVYIVKKNNDSKSNESGTITFIVNSIDDEIVEKKRISYNKGTTLFEILDKEYTLDYKITAYGHYLIGIKEDTFNIQTNGTSSWLWFEVAYLKDGKSYTETIDFSNYEQEEVSSGIDGISLEDEMIFAINERDSSHETSIFNKNITFKTTKKGDKIFRILVYSLSGAFLLGLIFYIALSRKNKKALTVKELCILAFMTVILFLQEELLSVIPNFQLTFMLLAVYVKVFGFRKTSMIVLAHVLLDNIIMGSLIPIVMIPMYAGYMIYIGLIYFVRNKNIWLITLMGVIGPLLYCYFFLITNAVFLDINIYIYWLSDIPFEIMLVSSTVFSIYYFYTPLSKKLNALWNPEPEVLDLTSENSGEI